jgi:outer membrane protein OmpA-like peptidoglycan-associated protein/opacity protein-like surface antigen
MAMKRILLGTVAALVSGAAAAQTPQGFYIGAAGGISWLNEGNMAIPPMGDSGLAPPSDHFRVQWDPGYLLSLSAGWAFGIGLRAEVEGVFRSNEANAGGGEVFTRNAGGGRADSQAVMLNLYWDFGKAGFAGLPPDTLMPYIGAGLGYGWRQLSDVGGRVAGNTLLVNDEAAAMVYQFMAGVVVPMRWTGVPGLYASVEFRHIIQEQPSLNAYVSSPSGASRMARADVASHSNNLVVGLRYVFGARAPVAPAAAAPAPAPTRSYLVFFDWNRADLTDRARRIIADAAAARSTQAVTRIEVQGHTDSSGLPRTNQALSERRAAAVSAELVRLGVPRAEIVAQGFGQQRLLVPTGDNVREPQNRRVEIVLR